jgi:hypothetical protein
MYPYSINGFKITFSDFGLLLDPKEAEFDNPEFISALKTAQSVYDEVNNIHSIGDYCSMSSYDGAPDEWFDEMIERCERAENQTVVPIPNFIAHIKARLIEGQNQLYVTRHKSPRKKVVGYVYLLRANTGNYKIGKTKDPSNRMRTFGIQLPFEVEYEHLIKSADMGRLEATLHKRFKDRRINGEWFDLSADDVAYIKSIGGESC